MGVVVALDRCSRSGWRELAIGTDSFRLKGQRVIRVVESTWVSLFHSKGSLVRVGLPGRVTGDWE